jgi:hypothetical protein
VAALEVVGTVAVLEGPVTLLGITLRDVDGNKVLREYIGIKIDTEGGMQRAHGVGGDHGEFAP